MKRGAGGVVLVAGRQPGGLVRLAISSFSLPKNSEGPAVGAKRRPARPQAAGGLTPAKAENAAGHLFGRRQACSPLSIDAIEKKEKTLDRESRK